MLHIKLARAAVVEAAVVEAAVVEVAEEEAVEEEAVGAVADDRIRLFEKGSGLPLGVCPRHGHFRQASRLATYHTNRTSLRSVAECDRGFGMISILAHLTECLDADGVGFLALQSSRLAIASIID